MKKRFLVFAAALPLALVLISSAYTAEASQKQSAADYYAKNTIALQVGYTPGGGTDYLARIFATAWKKITGGDMVVQNKPGGGGMEATNFTYNAKPDGLTLVIHPVANDLLQWLFKNPAIQYQYNKMQFIGFFLDETQVLAVGAGSPHAKKSLDEFRKIDGLKLGAGAATGNQAVGSALAIELLGLKNAKVVFGLHGSAGLGLTTGKGEVDAAVNIVTAVKSQHPKFFNVPLVNLDTERTPYWPEVPAVTEAAKLTPEQKDLLKTYLYFRTGKVIWANAGVPADRIEFLRRTFDRIMNVDSFKQQVKTRWPVVVPPKKGEEIAKEIQALMSKPVDKFIQAIGKHLPVQSK